MIEDPSIFLADFGEAGTLDGEAVLGIFGSPYATAPLGEASMSTSEPRFLLPAESVPASADGEETDVVLDLAAGAALRYPGGIPFRYLVRAVEPDGTGWASLVLSVHPDQTP